jgi:acyl-CoA reductase-like NAD-dependent aldehyde dehydrogenase
MRVYSEESFGPVVAIVVVDGVDEAVRVANDEPPMPFGGIKHSGWGRFGGKAALEEFTELRWIAIQDSPREYPI